MEGRYDSAKIFHVFCLFKASLIEEKKCIFPLNLAPPICKVETIFSYFLEIEIFTDLSFLWKLTTFLFKKLLNKDTKKNLFAAIKKTNSTFFFRL